MIELKCKRCDTGLFKVEDIARGLGKLPLRLTCHICGIQYIVKLDENGSPAVFYRKSGQRWRKMEIAGLKEIEPAPGPEVTGGEKEPAPGTEEPAGDEIEPAPSPEESTTSPEKPTPEPAPEGTAEEEE